MRPFKSDSARKLIVKRDGVMNKQLLLWGTVKHSLLMLWHNRNIVTKISLVWLLILIPLS